MPLRFHWPRGADLRVNGMVYHAYGRNGATKLGNNGRDAPADIGVPCGARLAVCPPNAAHTLDHKGLQQASALDCSASHAVVPLERGLREQHEHHAWRYRCSTAGGERAVWGLPPVQG